MPHHVGIARFSGLAARRGAFLLTAACLVALGLACVTSSPAAEEGEPSALFRTGKYAECVDAAAKAVAASGYNESAWLLKIRAELELGRFPDALASLDAGLEKLPNSLQLRFLGRDVCRFAAQNERVAKLEAEMVDLLKQSPWRYSDVANQIVVGRWMLSQRVDPKKVLKSVYQEAQKRSPGNVDVRIAIGELALAKHDFQLAGDAFQQAVKLDSDNPDALLGIAQAFAPSDAKKATEALEQALRLNPRHVPALLMVVDEHIDAERYDDAQRVLAQIAQINPKHPRALAYLAVLAHLRNRPDSEKLHRAAALRYFATNPEVDHLIGRKLSQKYRFAEGAEYQRRALSVDPEYLAAKTQLAQDLLRLGQEEQGLKLAEEVYAADAYNVFAHNLVTLQESLAKFQTLEAEGIVVRMEAREAEIYGRRVLDLLLRAKRDLCAKYDVKLEQPVIVELFPRQQDFAIRTFGLPGGAGFLGVCFGTVITANSPASQGANPSCWEATLWHEFCHVVTLNKTNNKMPRWLSEGISVYEERQADPTWGQSLNPRYRDMILSENLTPVSELSGAFLRPRSPVHLQFAYFESSLVVEYLIEKHGRDTLQRVLVDLGAGMPINESLARYVGSIEALDDRFAQFARDRAHSMAPRADWSEPELPRRATASAVAKWLEEHPRNYGALRRLAELQIADKQWSQAAETLEQMRQLFPRDGSSGGSLALLAKVYRQTDDRKREREVLEKLAELSCSDLAMLERLGELTAQAEEWKSTAAYMRRALAVQPLAASTHRLAALAAEKTGDDALAIDSYRALLLLEPFDPAEAHYKLAAALRRRGDLSAAKRHALFALEETPRYRAAQQLLLEIIAQLEKTP